MAATVQIHTINASIIGNPYALFVNGKLFSKFIPHNPDTILGIERITVTEVSTFITLFKELSITEENNSLVPFKISR